MNKPTDRNPMRVTGTLVARNRYPLIGMVETEIQVDAVVPSYGGGARYAIASVAMYATHGDDWWGYGPDLVAVPVEETALCTL